MSSQFFEYQLEIIFQKFLNFDSYLLKNLNFLRVAFLILLIDDRFAVYSQIKLEIYKEKQSKACCYCYKNEQLED